MRILSSARGAANLSEEDAGKTITVVGTGEPPLKMSVQISLEHVQNKNYLKARLEFARRSAKISWTDLQVTQEMAEVVVRYQKQVADTFTAIMHDRDFTAKKTPSQNSNMLSKLFSLGRISDGIKLFRDIRALNIYTVDSVTGSAIARTTIELDADIITIVAPGVENLNVGKVMLVIHRYNAQLGNVFLNNRLVDFFSAIQEFLRALRLAVLVIGYSMNAISLYSLFNSASSSSASDLLSSHNFISYAVQAVFLFLPALLYKYAPRIVRFFLWKKIRALINMS